MAADDSHAEDADPIGLRSDARHNRERILRAARTAFAVHGIDAPLTTIARQAGVGVATLYRRFPTRAALVTETFSEQFHQCNAVLTNALQDPDPWDGLCDLLRTICAMQAADRGFTEAFFTRYPDALDRALLTRAEHSLATLVHDCQQAGRVRPDVCATDLTLALMANAGIVARLSQPGPASARLVSQLLRAFATDPSQPLPPPPKLGLHSLMPFEP
jgi:AcrR family transcriptional regulator